MLPPLNSRHDGLTNPELWAAISDPRNSHLPPALFAELTRLGADIVRADATGQGPHTRPVAGGRAQPCCRSITIHAAGADRDPGLPDGVRVVVIWSGHGHGGTVLPRRVTIVRLVRVGNRWVPIPASK